jgi:hypothetical protein
MRGTAGHHQHSGSAPATLGGEMLPKQPQGHAASAGQFKVPESVAARAAAAGLQLQLGSGGSLCMPGTPSITGTQSRATPSPPTTPGSGQVRLRCSALLSPMCVHSTCSICMLSMRCIHQCNRYMLQGAPADPLFRRCLEQTSRADLRLHWVVCAAVRRTR